MFSGTLRRGEKFRIQGPKYIPGTKNDLFIKAVKGIYLMHGTSVEPLEDCPAGNIVAICGIEPFLATSGTLTDSDSTHNVRTARFSVAPVIQVAVDIRNPAQLPRLVEDLKSLVKSHSHLKTGVSDTGEHYIAGEDEEQLKAGLKVGFTLYAHKAAVYI